MGRIRKRWTRPIGPPAASRFLHSIYVTPQAGVRPLPGNEILWRAYSHVALIAHFQQLARS